MAREGIKGSHSSLPTLGSFKREFLVQKIEAVDFFYLSMPEVTTEGDGSQDALLARVTAGGLVGWGECEASPLVSIAAFVCPMSHGACRPVGASVLGQSLERPEDIYRIAAQIDAAQFCAYRRRTAGVQQRGPSQPIDRQSLHQRERGARGPVGTGDGGSRTCGTGRSCGADGEKPRSG